MQDQHPTRRQRRGGGPRGERVAGQVGRAHRARGSGQEKRGGEGGRRQNGQGPVRPMRAMTWSCAQEVGREDHGPLRGKRWGRLPCLEMTDCHASEVALLHARPGV